MEEEGTNRYFFHELNSDFGYNRPITFEVRLANGDCHLISTMEIANVLNISPTTHIENWINY